MRVAVANWTRRMAGGAERYVGDTMRELRIRDVEVALLYEVDEPSERELLWDGVPCWFAGGGVERALTAVRHWRPDVLLVHGLLDPGLEARLQRVAPSVLVAHAYYGTCISGEKTWKTVPVPCSRPLGLACLAHYYPHRCGGLSPVTMIRDYRLQRKRNALLRQYRAVVTLSRHMELEMRQAGAPAVFLPLLGPGVPASRAGDRAVSEPWRLLFVGRMSRLKGGDLLLDALARLRPEGPKVHVTFAGDGPERQAWMRRAGEVERVGRVSMMFPGWLGPDELEELWRGTQLFVFPSIWPEPLGLVGAEAGIHGIPTIGFDVGGVREWLWDGTNGRLLDGHPAAATLAKAIDELIDDPAAYAALVAKTAIRSGVVRLREHVDALVRLLKEVAGGQVHRRVVRPETGSAIPPGESTE